MSVFFNGQLLVTPVTASAVNDDAMLNQNLSVGNAIAFVGIAQGGEPGKVLSFGSPNEAKRVLVGGELCDAVVAAFAPSEETGSPQTVHAVRVNKAFRAKLELPNTSGINPQSGPFATLYGKSWGKDDATIKVKIEDKGMGYLTVTVQGGSGNNVWSVIGREINKPGVNVVLKQPSTSLKIASNNLEVTSDVGLPTEAKTVIDLSLYPTLRDVADFLDTIRNSAGNQIFGLEFEDPAYAVLPPTVLDNASYKADASTHDKIVSAHWNGYSIKKWFDENLSDYLDFELNAENKDAWLLGPQAGPDYRYLTAIPAAAPTQPDWDKAIAALETKDVQWVQVVSGEPAIHAMVQAHCDYCSNVLHKERRSICGTKVGVSDEEAIAAAKSLNSKRVSLVHIGHYDYDANGKLVLRPAYMTAGLVGAAFAGVNPGTPLTNKTLAVRGLERDLRNPTDTDKLLLGGVMPIENTETGYKVTQSITTWIADSKYNNREQSCGVAIDFAIRNVRVAVDVLRGQKQSPILLSRAVSLAKGALAELARPEPQGPAVLVGDEKSPAYRNVTATIAGDVLRIQFEASPAIPNNYILVTMYAVPYSGSATA